MLVRLIVGVILFLLNIGIICHEGYRSGKSRPEKSNEIDSVNALILAFLPLIPWVIGYVYVNLTFWIVPAVWIVGYIACRVAIRMGIRISKGIDGNLLTPELNKIFLSMQKIIAQELDIEINQIQSGSNLLELGADGTSLPNIMYDMEEWFSVDLPEDEIPADITIGILAKIIQGKINETN